MNQVKKENECHAYKMAEENKPVFQNVDPKWGGREELLLLSAIETNGHGNWETIAKNLSEKTGKEFTLEEIEEHYDNIYVHGIVGNETWNSDYFPFSYRPLEDHTSHYDDSILNSKDIYTAENVSENHLQDLQYMPLREDFEKDYDMNAEYLLDGVEFHNISQKPFHKNERNLVREVELAVVQIYRRRVQERYRRREIVKKYRLVEQYYQFGRTVMQRGSLKRKRSRFYSEAVSEFLELACFARFFSYEEFQNFFQLCLKERVLKKEIQELIALREDGVTNVADVEDFELLNSKLLRIDNSTVPKLSKNLQEVLLDSVDEESNESEDLDSPEENEEDDYLQRRGFFFPVLQGYKLLSVLERTLCVAMNLRPAYYIAYKTVLIFADIEKQKGNSIESFNLKPFGLDEEQCLEIVNFMAEHGWIRCNNLLSFEN